MNRRSSLMKFIVCLFPVVAIFLVYIFRNSLITIGDSLPDCPINNYFHIYCPGCGNTRSVICLLNSDVAGSARYNITPIFAVILALLAYMEYITYIFGKHIYFVPRNRTFWKVTITVFLIYFILRNFV